jgi:hypothetical protein
VLGIYLVGAWVAFQGIEALVCGLGLPEWVPGFALVVYVLGVPRLDPIVIPHEGPGILKENRRLTVCARYTRPEGDLPTKDQS